MKKHSPRLMPHESGMHFWVCTRCEATSSGRHHLQTALLPCPGGPVKAHPRLWGNLIAGVAA